MEEALVILSRCTDHHSRRAAAVIAAMLGREEVAESYGLQVIEDALLHLEWDLAMNVIQEIPSLNASLPKSLCNFPLQEQNRLLSLAV